MHFTENSLQNMVERTFKSSQRIKKPQAQWPTLNSYNENIRRSISWEFHEVSFFSASLKLTNLEFSSKSVFSLWLFAGDDCFVLTDSCFVLTDGCFILTGRLFSGFELCRLRNLNSFESITRTTSVIMYSVAGDADQTPSRPKKIGRIKSRGKRTMKIFPKLMKSAALILFIDW